MTEDIFPSEKISDRSMPGKGNGHTKLITFEHAIELVMVLPGRVAKETRMQFADIIRRYLAGDHSLISEVRENAQSSSPVAVLARESLGITTDEDLTRKRRRDELELERLNVENAKMSMENKQSNFKFFLGTMDDLDPHWKKDTRLLTQTKDLLKNICLGPQAITDGTGKAAPPPLYIHEVALQLGFGRLSHAEACKVGRRAVEMYRAKYDEDPPTRLQFVDGAERQVKAYTEEHRGLLEGAVQHVMTKMHCPVMWKSARFNVIFAL